MFMRQFSLVLVSFQDVYVKVVFGFEVVLTRCSPSDLDITLLAPVLSAAWRVHEIWFFWGPTPRSLVQQWIHVQLRF